VTDRTLPRVGESTVVLTQENGEVLVTATCVSVPEPAAAVADGVYTVVVLRPRTSVVEVNRPIAS